MSVSRIKSLAIAALVLINVFFLTLIIHDSVTDARSERQALENAVTVLENAGIIIDPSDIITHGTLRTMRTTRNIEAEERIAQAALGSTVMTEHGLIYVHESDRGRASFGHDGTFDISLNEDVVTNANGTLRAVERLLRDMRIEVLDNLHLYGRPGAETVVADLAYKGVGVFNSAIRFEFIDGSLRAITGRNITVIETAEDTTEISSVSTALLGFLAEVRRGDYEAMWIKRVEAGYFYRVGEGVLVPVWLITANGIDYIIDGETGNIEARPNPQ